MSIPKSDVSINNLLNNNFNLSGLLDLNDSQVDISAIVKNEEIDQLFKAAVLNINQAKEAVEVVDKHTKRKERNAKRFERKQNAGKTPKPVYNIALPDNRKFNSKEILDLFFSQDSIDGKTGDGSMTMDELVESMSTHGWLQGTSITVIEMPDETYVSADNRRLYAAMKVAKMNPAFSISVNIFAHDIKAPKKLLKGIEKEYVKGHPLTTIEDLAALTLPKGITPGTYGYAMVMRINTRHGNLAESHFGYKQTPVIR